MHRPPAVRVIAAAGALSVLLAALLCRRRHAGRVHGRELPGRPRELQHDGVQRLRDAGHDDPPRVQPGGPGIRGLVTANSTRRGTVPRGSVAMVAISAPERNALHHASAGRARRADATAATRCSSTPRDPDIKPVPIKNVRANQHCPRPARAQAAGYRSRTFNVTGATRIVQRVICVGGDGRKSCSARGTNYIRTYQAEVGVVDEQAPTATIAADTPLATGAWVSGSQPLQLRRPGQRRRPTRAGRRRRSRRRLRAATLHRWPRRRARTRTACPARTAPGSITVKTHRALRRDPAARRPGPGHRGERRCVGARRRCASTTPRRRE